jgi:hypothetical protein
VALADRFAAIFNHPQAQARLLQLAQRTHTRLATFNLATTSLRHTPKWFDRLAQINAGITRPHGNFLSDPASIGLVDTRHTPARLTRAGRILNAIDPAIKSDRQKGEYQLIKTLYYSGLRHTASATSFLRSKQINLHRMLSEFVPTATRRLLLSRPSLLVIAELLTDFPGAVRGLLLLSGNDLRALSDLGEDGFENLCSTPRFSPGLERLCRRIGADYHRGQERRLNYIVSATLCEVANGAPQQGAAVLTIPAPFSQFLTEVDVHNLHAQYTDDLTIWFDGTEFYVSRSLSAVPAGPVVAPIAGGVVSLLLNAPRRARRGAKAGSARRGRRRAAAQTTTVIWDSQVAERAEDWIEAQHLQPTFGARLRRVGHRLGEIIPLPDGMVPGADFYVIDRRGNPVEFIEIKSISGPPPAEISLTRAEYLRALRCAAGGIPYRVILVDVINNQYFEVDQFLAALAAATLEHVVRFSVRVG